MAAVVQHQPSFHDTIWLKLAREIAMDIHDLEKILEIHEVSLSEWESIKEQPVFRNYLRSAMEEWNSAQNTAERVRVKSLAFVEEALPEFFARAHDKDESLSNKTEVLKTIAKFAGLDKAATEAQVGERLSVTINLGADHQLRIERDVTSTGNLIEGTAE